jgi:hypothetical protein
MASRLFTLLSALSLLLCVAVVVLWVRGLATWDRVSVGVSGGPLVRVGSGRGRVTLLVVRRWPLAEPLRWESEPVTEPVVGPSNSQFAPLISYATRAPAGVGISNWKRLGLSRWYGNVTTRLPGERFAPPMPGCRVYAPAWMVVAATGVAPAAWLAFRLFRRRRRRAGFCAACGYDLRATPARCPECGTLPAAKQA